MADISTRKITTSDLTTYGVQAEADTLTGTAAENKTIFDRLITSVVMVKLNALIDDLQSTGTVCGGDNLGIKAIPELNDGVAGTVYEMLVSLKANLNSAVLGSLSEASITEAYLTADAVMKSLLTGYAVSSVTEPSVLATTDKVKEALGKLQKWITNFSDGTSAVNKATNYAAGGNIASGFSTEVTSRNEAIASAITTAKLAMFPVGAIYMSAASTNPGTFIGGTWVAWGAGRVPVGIDAAQTEFDTAEETGGAKTHTLTTDEMPSHNHVIHEPHSTGTTARTIDLTSQISTSEGAVTASRGGGAAHNNLQPYIVCYMWKRTA